MDDGGHGETLVRRGIHAGHNVDGQVRGSKLGARGSVLAATDHLDLRLLHDAEIVVKRCCEWRPSRRSATEDGRILTRIRCSTIQVEVDEGRGYVGGKLFICKFVEAEKEWDGNPWKKDTKRDEDGNRRGGVVCNFVAGRKVLLPGSLTYNGGEGPSRLSPFSL